MFLFLSHSVQPPDQESIPIRDIIHVGSDRSGGSAISGQKKETREETTMPAIVTPNMMAGKA